MGVSMPRLLCRVQRRSHCKVRERQAGRHLARVSYSSGGAVDGPHGLGRIAFAGNLLFRDGGFELGNFGGCQANLRGGGVLFESHVDE